VTLQEKRSLYPFAGVLSISIPFTVQIGNSGLDTERSDNERL
jgi:hypothetical protein